MGLPQLGQARPELEIVGLHQVAVVEGSGRTHHEVEHDTGLGEIALSCGVIVGRTSSQRGITRYVRT
jgi:hypothetical protein